MPVAVWPPALTASASPSTPDTPDVSTAEESPDKPPPLGRARTSDKPDMATRQVVPTPSPGLFTTEFRRALPSWALPLLTFQPFSVWLGARLALTLLGILAFVMIPGIQPAGTANWYGSPGGPPLTTLVDRLAGVWTRWDGQWYLKIATEGYSVDDGSAAFYPLYPLVLKIFGWMAGERYIWAGTVVSALFFLAALILLHRLVRLDFHPEDANRAVFYIAAFPMAFFFWAVYSESLFLFLAVATLLAARLQRWWLAALAASFAIWTRSTGLLLLLPLAWELWRAYRPPMPKDPRSMPPPRPHRLSLAALSLPLLSLLLLLGWAGITFGDPLAVLTAQRDWNRSFSWPWETVANAFRVAANTPFAYQAELQSWTYLGALVLAFGVGLVGLRWLRGSYSLYLWAGILFPLFSATRNNPLLSYPRFLLVLFPAFIVLALAGRNRYANQIITWVSLILLALYSIRFMNWYWVA